MEDRTAHRRMLAERRVTQQLSAQLLEVMGNWRRLRDGVRSSSCKRTYLHPPLTRTQVGGRGASSPSLCDVPSTDISRCRDLPEE
jgi:hypothetical protein